MMTDYPLLVRQAEALIRDVPHNIANLANLSALLYDALEDLNWAGFYLLEGDTLILGPFQGKVACTTIPVGKGVCGTAVQEDRTQLVFDVHRFPGHIGIYGVLDIDSPTVGRFTEADQAGLEQLVRVLEQHLI